MRRGRKRKIGKENREAEEAAVVAVKEKLEVYISFQFPSNFKPSRFFSFSLLFMCLRNMLKTLKFKNLMKWPYKKGNLKLE